MSPAHGKLQVRQTANLSGIAVHVEERRQAADMVAPESKVGEVHQRMHHCQEQNRNGQSARHRTWRDCDFAAVALIVSPIETLARTLACV
jgi:hypothetical protein